MPLLKRKPYTIGPLIPSDLKPGEEVFVVRATGEAVRDYEEYLAKIHLYQSRAWSSIYTGKSNLTYEEALMEEQKSSALLQKFPKELERPVAEKVQFSTLRLEELVNHVYDAYRPPDKPSGKENEPDHKQKHPLPRPVIKRWIQEIAEQKDGLWSVNQDLVAKFALNTAPPQIPLLAEPARQKQRRSSGACASPVSPVAKTKAPAPADARTDMMDADPPASCEPAQPPVVHELPKPPRTWQEEEGRLKPGTAKHAAFTLMRRAAPTGLSVNTIIAQSTEEGIKTDWSDSSKSSLMGLLVKDPIFVRVGKGLYSLYGFPGVVPVAAMPPKPRKVNGEGTPAMPEHAQQMDARASAPPSGEGAASAAEQREAAEERDALKRAEEVAAQAQAALEQRQASLTQAQAHVEEIKARAATAAQAVKKATPTKKAKDANSFEEPMPASELAEEFREYSGPADDRKAFMAWKRRQDKAKEQLLAARDEWISQQKAKAKAARSAEKAVGGYDSKSLARATAALEEAQQEYNTAARAAAEAQRNVDREKQRVALREAREVQRVEREKARAAEREMREQRRLEALEARRYPIDDLQLLEELQAKAQEAGEQPPASDVAVVLAPLPREESDAVAERLYVLDLVGQFAKPLGLKQLPAEVEAALGSSQKLGEAVKQDKLSELGSLFEVLLQVLLDDVIEAGAAGRLEQRWRAVLGPATWPEVLRRYTVSRAYSSSEAGSVLVAGDVLSAVAVLGQHSLEELQGSKARVLLRFLCDEVLDTELMRSNMEDRLEKAVEAAADMRSDMAEDRKKLREIIESEKEARKRKREEALATAAAAAGQQMEANAEDQQPPSKKAKKATVQEEEEEEEPSFELPKELQEYTGDSQDRKAQLLFRQAQQAARKQLDKDKAQWLAGKRKREAAREVLRKAELAEEKRKLKEKEEAEEALVRRQEAYEKELEKLLVRRGPLGSDRHYRRYWWGVAGAKSAVWVEDEQGQWAALSTPAALDALFDSLDKRGVRELELRRSIEKYYAAITAAMRRAAKERDADSQPVAQAPSAPPPAKKLKTQSVAERQQPSRQGKKTDDVVEVPAKAQLPPPVQDAEDALFSGVELDAMEAAVSSLAEITVAAAAAAVTAPSGGWKSWRDGLKKTLGKGQTGDGANDEARAVVRKTLQDCMLELESLLVARTKECEVEQDEDEDEEGGDGEVAEATADEEQQGEGAGAVQPPAARKDAARRKAADASEDQEDEQDRQERAKRRLSHGHHGPTMPLEEEEEEVASDSEMEDRKHKKRCLWGSSGERASWRSCVAAAANGARVAYCAAVLQHAAEKPLQSMGKGKKRKAA